MREREKEREHRRWGGGEGRNIKFRRKPKCVCKALVYLGHAFCGCDVTGDSKRSFPSFSGPCHNRRDSVCLLPGSVAQGCSPCLVCVTEPCCCSSQHAVGGPLKKDCVTRSLQTGRTTPSLPDSLPVPRAAPWGLYLSSAFSDL